MFFKKSTPYLFVYNRMFTIDREDGATMLGISTRTLDRYIRAGKIRAKKKGKKVFLHSDDVLKLKGGEMEPEMTMDNRSYEIQEEVALEPMTQFVTKPLIVSYKELYEESKSLLARKDELIQDLSYRLGNIETELKNSIPMLEYKKATFLLESSQTKGEDERKDLTHKVEKLADEIKKEQNTNMILIIVLSFVLMVSVFAWFMGI